MKGNPFRNFMNSGEADNDGERPAGKPQPPSKREIIPPAGRPTPQSYVAMKRMFTSICTAYFHPTFEGVDNVPETGPVLVLSNHASYLDPLLVGIAIPREVHYLARQEILDWPVVGRMMQNTHAIRRGGIDRQAIQLCRDILKAGWPLIMFPEGTRSPDGKVYRPRGGFAWILETMQDVPCLPVYLEGTFEALKRGAFLPRPEPVQIRIGQPYTLTPRPEGMRRREHFELCADQLENAWRELGAEVRSQELDY